MQAYADRTTHRMTTGVDCLYISRLFGLVLEAAHIHTASMLVRDHLLPFPLSLTIVLDWFHRQASGQQGGTTLMNACWTDLLMNLIPQKRRMRWTRDAEIGKGTVSTQLVAAARSASSRDR